MEGKGASQLPRFLNFHLLANSAFGKNLSSKHTKIAAKIVYFEKIKGQIKILSTVMIFVKICRFLWKMAISCPSSF